MSPGRNKIIPKQDNQAGPQIIPGPFPGPMPIQPIQIQPMPPMPIPIGQPIPPNPIPLGPIGAINQPNPMLIQPNPIPQRNPNRRPNQTDIKLKLEIPEGVRRIKDYCFKNCSEITSLTIPSTVTFIGEHVFEECSIEELDLPSSIQNISKFMFC